MEYHCKYDELVEPADLLDHPRNHNNHPERQLAALEAFIRHSGWRHPAVVSKLSGKIVAGHARKEAAIRLGCQVPVVYQYFESDAEERTFLAADNKLAELAEMDVELLDVEILELEDLDVPIYDFGFNKPTDSKSSTDIDIESKLIVEAECQTELEQEKLFNRLTEDGYKCRVLRL